MEKGKFSQNTTRFKDKSKNVQPVIIEIDLVNSLIGDEETKAPSVAAVNDALDGKLDALQNGDRNTTWLYGNDYTGKYGLFKASFHGKAGHIVMYGAPDRTGGFEPDGTIGVHMPEKPYQAVPREYVDSNTPSQIAVSMVTEGEGEEKKEYVLRLSLVNCKGNVIPDSETSIDLPLEMAFVGAEAVEDENGNEFVEFTLQNGKTIKVGLSEIFNGKVDKTTNAWKVYGTAANGVPNLFGISSNPNKGYIPQYGPNGILKTNAPEEDLDCVNKKTMNDCLAGKFSLPSVLSAWSLLGIGNYDKETGEYKPNIYTRNPLGGGNTHVATFGLATTESIWTGTEARDNPKYTLGGADPIYPVQYANKRYVDGKVAPLEQGLYNALGTMCITVEVKDFGVSIDLPSGAMKFAYIESLGVIKGYDDDGNELGVAEVHTINVGDTEHSIDDLPKYIEIPDGTQTITLRVTPPVGTIYTKGVGGKIIFQAKVGG